MRFIYVGDFRDPYSTETQIAAALERAGQQVKRIEESTMTCSTSIGCDGDVLLFAKAKFAGGWEIDPTRLIEWLAWHKRCGLVRKTCCWIFDLLHPAFNPNRYSWAAGIAEAVDLFCTTDGETAKLLQPQARVLRQAAPEYAQRGRPDPTLDSEALWLGGLYGERHDFVCRLLRLIGSTLWVVPGGFYGPDLARLIASTNLVIGPIWPFYPDYWSNRIYQVAGCGGLLATPDSPALQADGWEPYVHFLPLPTDQNTAIQECSRFCRAARNGNGAQTIRNAAYSLARQRHTYDHRIHTLMEWLA